MLELGGPSGGCGTGVFFTATPSLDSVAVVEAGELLIEPIVGREPESFELEIPDSRVQVSLFVGARADEEICSDAGSGIGRLDVQDAVGGSLTIELSFDDETGEPLGDLLATDVLFEPAVAGGDLVSLPPVKVTGARVFSAQG